MKTIHKYALEISDEQGIYMPQGAELLTVQMQYGHPCVWALVDTDAPPCLRGFAIRGTGHPARGLSRKDYVGTVQDRGGSLIWHVFDLGQSAAPAREPKGGV